MFLKILTLMAALSANFSAFASQAATSAEEQYKLAQTLTLSHESATLADVRYWLELSANQGHLPAQKQLAEDYSKGLSGDIDYVQATHWFTAIALSDSNDNGYLLAKFIQHHQDSITLNHLIEAWYQLASASNPQAEVAYHLYLEERFNQLRAKQVSDIAQLNKQTIKEKQQPVTLQSIAPNKNPLFIWLTVGGLVITIANLGGWLILKRQKHKEKALFSYDAHQTKQLDVKVRELEHTNRQLKSQLEKVFKEFKKAQTRSSNYNFAVACAMFGYTPQTIPDVHALKARYRQLSKIYHPDVRGSEEEMKRLNDAFKILSLNVTKR